MYFECNQEEISALEVISEERPILSISENGQDIIETEKGKKFFPPLFEIASNINIYTPGSSDPNLDSISQQINDAHNKTYEFVNKLKAAPYHCQTVMSIVRTKWTAISSYGPPKGPTHQMKSVNDMIVAAENHDCAFRKIASYDDPKNRTIGFCCICGRKWEIGLIDLKKDLDENPCEHDLATKEGRNKLAFHIHQRNTTRGSISAVVPDPGNGMEPFMLAYFTVRSLFGWDGDISKISFVESHK